MEWKTTREEFSLLSYQKGVQSRYAWYFIAKEGWLNNWRHETQLQNLFVWLNCRFRPVRSTALRYLFGIILLSPPALYLVLRAADSGGRAAELPERLLWSRGYRIE